MRKLDINVEPVTVVAQAMPARQIDMEVPKQKREKYAGVNGRWPEGTNSGRDIKLSPQEAVTAAKRLYRKAFGRPFRGKVKLTSGRRYTWIRNGVLYVNPNQGWRGGGLHEIVHMISHLASYRLHRENHGMRHAFIERTLIDYAISNGFHEGKLKRERKPKAPVDLKTMRRQRIEDRLEAWKSKRKRADTAIRKLTRQLKYYDRAKEKAAELSPTA